MKIPLRLRNLAITPLFRTVVAAILALLILLWIHSRIEILSRVPRGWKVDGQAIALIVLAFLAFWGIRWMIRRRRAKKSAPTRNSQPDQSRPDGSGWKVVKFILIFQLIMILFFFIVPWAIRTWRQPQANQQTVTATTYRKIICDDAWQHDVHEPRGDHFTVKLHEGCFGGLVYLPPGWNGWHYQPVGNDQNWWVTFWVEGDQNPRGPYDRNAKPSFTYLPMRFQGKEGEEILIYTTGGGPLTTPSSPETTNQPPILPSTDKGAYTKSVSVVTPAKVIHQINAEYTDEAKKAKFSGIVTVTLVIDEQGDPQNIEIENPPGFGLDEKIIEAVRQWKFKPVTKDGVPISTTGKIQMKFRLS